MPAGVNGLTKAQLDPSGSNLCGSAMETAPWSARGVQRGSALKRKRLLLDAINLQ